MKALLLAAGEGTRLRPLTLDRPKPMLPISGRPVLDHLVRLLRWHGVGEIAINLHYRPEAIVEYFADGRDFDVSIRYSHEEQLLGSAGAARQLQSFFDGPFFVLYGDVLTSIDLTRMAAGHRATGALATMALYEVEDASRCGMVATQADGRVTRFVEKPPAGWANGMLANAGIYVVEPAALRFIPESRPYDFGQHLFPDLLARGLPLYACPASAYVLDIGSFERYAQAEADALDGRYMPPPALLAC
jgi:NDP-sugar pyrophosphorylase family protein